jgi:ParB-like chromosome segregation protein Spo0J
LAAPETRKEGRFVTMKDVSHDASASRKPPTYKTVELKRIIAPSKRLRALRPEAVDAMVESMRARGQLQPIVVRKNPSFGRPTYTLVVGKHRYMAAKQLGWDGINASVVDSKVTDDEAKMMEIDENFIRADLTPAERAAHTGRRKELYEKLYPETKQGKAPGKAGGGKKAKKSNLDSFVSNTAKNTGQSASKVKRDTQRAKNIKVLDDIKGTSLDKGTELDALAKLPEEVQRALAARAKAGETVSAVSYLGDPDNSAKIQKDTNEKLFGGTAVEEKVASPEDTKPDPGVLARERDVDKVPADAEEKAEDVAHEDDPKPEADRGNGFDQSDVGKPHEGAEPADEDSAPADVEEQADAEQTAKASARAAKKSAKNLAEFLLACHAYLPKIVVEADKERAFQFVSKWFAEGTV